MTLLLLFLALFQASSQAGDWKVKSVAMVVQHSGAHRTQNTMIVGLLERVLATRPATAEVSIVGFDRDFEQLEGARFRRNPVVLQTLSSDGADLHDAVAGMVFHGPSPVWDAVIMALGKSKSEEHPERILLFSNGIDNASQATIDDAEEAARKMEVPISCVYLPATPTGGGDGKLKKLAKATGGKFIDLREKNSWDILMSALK